MAQEKKYLRRGGKKIKKNNKLDTILGGARQRLNR